MMATLVPIHFSLLSACLKSHSFDVELFDTTYYKTEEINFEQKKVELLQIKPFRLEEKGVSFKQGDVYEDLAKKVAEYRPDLIGITIVEDTYDLAMSLLKRIRYFNIPVIAGGVFVTFSPEEVIAHDTVDMLCIGEGEEAIVELCEKMSGGEDYTNVRNLWVKKGGAVVRNPLRPLTDINKVPFIDYDIFGRDRLYRPMFGKIFTMAHIEIDRGCPYSCTYCEAPHLRELFEKNSCGTYYRRKDTDRVISEMRYLIAKYNPDYVNFNSETFLAKPIAELKEFSRRYKTEVGIPFWCQTRPETITEEKVRILKDMNCESVQFGIEHGNEEFRAKMLNRHCSNRKIIDSLNIIERYGMPYTVNNIIGFPEETRELIFDTVEINRRINPRTMNCYLFTPYKGTRLHKHCIEKGYLEKDAKVHQLLDSVRMQLGSITYEELKGLQRTFPLYAKFPKSEWGDIRIAERFDKAGDEMYERLAAIFRKKYFGVGA